MPMSSDQKPSRLDENQRVLSMGGKVIYHYFPGDKGLQSIARVDGILAVSRAIGDAQFHPYVTADPEFVTKEIDPKEDLFLLLASDGLFDVMSNEEVSRFIFRKYMNVCSQFPIMNPVTKKRNQNYSKQFVQFAKQLCEEANILGSTDNITVQIVDLTI